MRECKAIITVATGRHGTRQFPVQRVESYTTQQSLDNDADQFSIDIGDSRDQLGLCLDRDNEIRVQLFLDNEKHKLIPIFNGIADVAQRGTDLVLSTQGRDTPSSLAVDSDALPGRWKHVNPETWIKNRAKNLGITNSRIANMSFINSLYTDGSEKEWALWYRIARTKGFYMWTDHIGTLIIDKLGYSLSPSYKFGEPPRGKSASGWHGVTTVTQVSNKQGRIRRVLLYGEQGAKKSGKAMVAQGIDTTIGSWRKKTLSIATSTTAKNQSELKQAADEEVFESIVGAVELEVTVQDTGIIILQNRMCVVNLPILGLSNEPWFIVGVERSGGADGMTQTVRLRQKSFALSKRVPDAPTLQTGTGSADNKPAASIGAALAGMPGIKWADSFVRATNEFGVPAGWEFATFLGVLLAICDKETGGTFNNCREGDASTNWQDYDQWVNSGDRLSSTKTAQELELQYQKTFANAKGNSLNPFKGREAGVGPMQLTYITFKQWADQYGWNGVAKTGEYAGGRWNPDSNIRASARALVNFGKQNPPANPTDPNSIWIAVKRYNGSTTDEYVNAVKAKYDQVYASEAQAAIASVKTLPVGSAVSSFDIPGHGVLDLPANTPDEAKKAITFCLRRLGDAYKWGGTGPLYDCSSLVTAALASAADYLRTAVVEPVQGKTHGDTTYTLFDKGKKVTKDNLLPGDLVFFRGVPPEHVGMYLADGLFVHDPSTGDVVKVSSVNDDWYAQRWSGARRFVNWFNAGSHNTSGPQAPTGTGARRVMIQAGHDEGGHGDQPYGHTGESGAPGEVSFTISVRDRVLALLDADPHFAPIKGSAWSASAGPTASAGDDVDFTGDMFISIHYDADNAGGSRYFFGWPTGRGASVLAQSTKLRDKIITEYNAISGHPTRDTGSDNSVEALYGYYAWGHPSRTSPNDIDHTPNVPARLLIETGEGGSPGGSDRPWLTSHIPAIARAIYRGICSYYGYNPVGS